MSEVYKDCIGISTNGTRQQNVVDFSTRGGEHCKTYVKLHDCINEKNKSCRSKTITVNLNLSRSGKNYILKLEKQLQAHKDKEDNLREVIDKYLNTNSEIDLDDFIKILDGSDE